MQFKIKTILMVCLMSFSVVSVSIQAAEIKSGQMIDLKGDVKQDLYAGAGKVSIAGNVIGDAIIGGGEITFKGKIAQDAQFAGGKIHAEITGADDVRIMGGEIHLTVKNTGDVFLFGGDIELDDTSDIKGDLFIMGGKVILGGHIHGNVSTWSGDIQIKGIIDGNLKMRGENTVISSVVKGASSISSSTLSVEPEARFTGPVEYWSKQKIDFHNSVKNGTATFNEDLGKYHHEKDWGMKWAWLALWFPASAALTIFLMLFFMPTLVRQSSEKVLSAPIAALGYGVLFDIIAFVLIILLFISFIGIAHALFLSAMYFFGIIFARPITSAILAAALAKKLNKSWSKGMLVLIGLVVYGGLSLLFMFPVIGFLLNLLAIWIAWGAMVQTLYERYRASKS